MKTKLSATPTTSAETVAVTPVPVGTIIAYASTDEPDGWLLCNGQAISSNDYPELQKLIGNTVPDLRNRFIVGAGSTYSVGNTGGSDTITLTTEQIPAHKHYGMGEYNSKWTYGTSGSNNQMGSNGGVDYDNYIYGTTDTGGGQSHENRPPYYALTYLIKY